MKLLFSPGIPSPPSSTFIDVSNEEVLQSSIKAENKRKAKRLASFLPIALLILGFLGFVAYISDFKSGKHTITSEVKIKSLERAKGSEDEIPYEETKLSGAFMPLMYAVDLKFLLKGQDKLSEKEEYAWEDTFQGRMEMHIMCIEESSIIEINAQNLKIDDSTIHVCKREGQFQKNTCPREQDSAIVKLLSFKENPKTNKWIFQFESPFLPNDHIILTFNYNGPVSSNSYNGIYHTTYLGKDGKKRSTLTTKFEPIHARKVFPCFDEPDKKSTWKIRVSNPPQFTVLSNSVVQKITDDENGLKTTEFEETPIMSSYLVAIVIGHLTGIYNTTNRGTKVGIYGNSPISVKEKEFALEETIKGMEFMEEYTTINYPMKKIDSVAVTQFESSAMENWGLVIFKDNTLLFNGRFSPEYSKMMKVTTIYHEIAHQWFGNLVTLKDWQYTWLNEGFAAFFQTIILVAQKPDMGTMEYFGSMFIRDIMSSDALHTSHPLTMKMMSSEDAIKSFDGITYGKGSAILFVIRQLMTPQAFDLAVQDYLQRNKYENAVPQDLFESFNRFVPDDFMGPDGKKFNVELFLRQYTEQSGLPLITVTRKSDGKVGLSQERYRTNADFKDIEPYANPEFGYKWDVPIWYHDGKAVKFVWLKRKDLIIESEGPIVLNVQGTMYYKYVYAKEEFGKFVSNVTLLENFPMEVVEGMFTHVFDPTLLHIYTPETLMELSKNMVNQNSPFVPLLMGNWITILSHSFSSEITDLMMNVETTLSKGHKNKFSSSQTYTTILMKQYEKAIKSYSEEKIEKVLEELKTCGSPCLKELTKKSEGKFSCKDPSERTSECSTIPPEARFLFYCNMVKNDSKQHNVLLNYYKNEIVEIEKSNLLSGMLCTNDKELIKMWLDKTIDKINSIDVQLEIGNIHSIYEHILNSPIGASLAMNFVFENWKAIQEKVKNYPRTLLSIIQTIGVAIDSDEKYEKFVKFMNDNPETQQMIPFLMQKELANTRIKWDKLHKASLIKLFS